MFPHEYKRVLDEQAAEETAKVKPVINGEENLDNGLKNGENEYKEDMMNKFENGDIKDNEVIKGYLFS